MYRYKTAYCPQKNFKHDWNQCIYAHKPQDYRRPPDKFVYEPDDCKALDTSSHKATHPTASGGSSQSNASSLSLPLDEGSCPLGFKCKKAHSTYERLYHPK